LTEAEIQRMVREAEENAESDKQQKELIDARNNAEGTTHSIKKDYDTYKDQLTEEERTAFEDASTAVETACAGEDKDAIQKSVEAFFNAAGPVMAKKQAAESAPAQTESAQPAEQTVDASFTEVDKEEKK